MEEYLEEENYWGFGPSYIDGKGYRKRGTRPSAVLESEDFSKSLLGDLGEEEYDEWGRRKKKKGRELIDINVEELSFVDVPATKKTFSVIKGLKGDDEMKKSNFRWSDNCQRVLRGYSDSDLGEIDEEDLEIEKSSDSNPFPSLASIFNDNKEALEEAFELATAEERAI